ncbi:MAG TPA: biotin/lipoyl-binding protein, partial [Terriglobales bacterium]|nr:biotin/lipoyl-binding protein [Terriglobales bacterium]
MAGCAKKPADPPKEAPPVTVATVAQRDIPVNITAIGNVDPIQTVQVRSMVNGQIDQVLFREGQEVRQGEMLFKLDQ